MILKLQEVKGSKTEGAGLFLLEQLGYEPLKLRESALRSSSDRSAILPAPVTQNHLQAVFKQDSRTLIESENGGESDLAALSLCESASGLAPVDLLPPRVLKQVCCKIGLM